MRVAERHRLHEIYAFRCGYCGVSEAEVGAKLTVDHFRPRPHGGSDDPSNWVYCCHACNEFKGDYWPHSSPQRILQPLLDNLHEHVVARGDGVLEALTASSAFHIERLRLNRPGLVRHRRERILLDRERQHQMLILQRLTAPEPEVQDLSTQPRNLEGDSATS